MAKQKPATDQTKRQASRRSRTRCRKYSLAEWFGYGDKPDPAWGKFSRKHRNNPGLKDDTLCAMPETLVNAILYEMPEFFSKKEEEFERDLAQMAGGGFFLRRPFGYPPIKGSTLGDSPDSNVAKQQQKRSSQEIKQLLAEGMQEHGRSPLGIEQHFANADKIIEKIEARKWGYAGWLVTNPDFRKECTAFRMRWESWIKAIGGFPVYPTDFQGHSPVVPKEIREFYDDYTQFYQRWCIHTFVTWDLPVPMLAGIANPIFYPLSQVSSAGMALFLPWYLLRDQTFKLQDLAKHERFSRGPDHLQGWFGRDRNKWGHGRLGTMLKMYIYFELCLKRRYAERLEGRIDRLNLALGHFLGDATAIGDEIRYKEHNVESIRKEMNKRLRECAKRTKGG
jgi:hypothetical protein